MVADVIGFVVHSVAASREAERMVDLGGWVGYLMVSVAMDRLT